MVPDSSHYMPGAGLAAEASHKGHSNLKPGEPQDQCSGLDGPGVHTHPGMGVFKLGCSGLSERGLRELMG